MIMLALSMYIQWLEIELKQILRQFRTLVPNCKCLFLRRFFTQLHQLCLNPIRNSFRHADRSRW